MTVANTESHNLTIDGILREKIIGRRFFNKGLESIPNFAKGIRGRILDIRTRSKFQDMFCGVPGVRVDQTIPGSGNSLRPDLFLTELGGRSVILEVGSPLKIGGILKYEGISDDLFPLIPIHWVP